MTDKEAIEKLKEILFMTGYSEALDLAIKALEERPHGKWICTFHSTFPQYEPNEYRCSICKGIGDKTDKFCNHCGADMRGE